MFSPPTRDPVFEQPLDDLVLGVRRAQRAWERRCSSLLKDQPYIPCYMSLAILAQWKCVHVLGPAAKGPAGCMTPGETYAGSGTQRWGDGRRNWLGTCTKAMSLGIFRHKSCCSIVGLIF